MVRSKDKAKRRKPLTTFSRAGFNQAGKKTVKERVGYLWTHILTADESEAKRLDLFYKRAKKRPGHDYKIVQNGDVFEVFVRKE